MSGSNFASILSNKPMTLANYNELLEVNDIDFVARLSDFDCSVSQIDRAITGTPNILLQIEC